MKLIAVDDELSALHILSRAIKEAIPEAELLSLSSARETLERVRGGYIPDVIFTDIELPEVSGVELAEQLKKLVPNVNIVFVTGYSQYMGEAFALHATGYLMKPVSAEKILKELRNLRYPFEERTEKRIRFRCFGNFEAFIEGKPLRFERSKTKELLACLVDRQGSSLNTAELSTRLWEDYDDVTAQHKMFRKLMSDLTRTLKSVDAEDILCKAYNSFAIDPEKVECDFYDFLNGSPEAIKAYRGEYMTQYSWAEMTVGLLDSE